MAIITALLSVCILNHTHDYANRRENKVKQCYLEKISATGIDPVLMEGKNFETDCLPVVESPDLLFYIVLEISFYTKQ